MKVEIYSDVVCPWCYIGERRFNRALADFTGSDEVEVVFRPYQLDPDAPEQAVPLTEYLERRYGPRGPAMQEQVGAVAAEEGIVMEWERALSANTRLAHRLLQLALADRGAKVQRDLAERLFELHFTRGGNLADPAQLAAEAGQVGLDPDRVAEYLISGEGAEELEAEFERARGLGIQAVPTFVFDDKWAVQGAQSPEIFAQALEQVASGELKDAPGQA